MAGHMFKNRRRISEIPAIVIAIAVMTNVCKKADRSDQQIPSEITNIRADLSGKVGWREDNRTGVSSETGLLKSWPEGGPALVWSTAELPEGFSSVAIGNNTIYLTGFDSQNENDVLVAIDDMGKIKWQTPYGRSWDGSHAETRCTPTIDSDRIYVSSGYGDLACVEANTGEIIWQSKASETYKGTSGNWGIAESLLVDGEKVYYSPGGPETTTIALNKLSGDLVWKSASLNDKTGYVSPILVDYASKRMLINVSLGHVYGVNVDNGEILWSVAHSSQPRWGDHIICVTPLFKDGMVYVTEGYDAGGMMVKIAEDGKSARAVWTDKVLDVHHGGVVLVDGCIYGANWSSNANGNWCCIDWNTGKKMYEEHWECKGSIIAADGMLYVYDERSGNVGLVKPDPSKFDLVSSFKVKLGSGPYWSHPVVHNGFLYLRHGKALMVYDIRTKT
jgi:outer membrane protein assembly factor BamB